MAKTFRITIEECLFQITTPAALSTCASIHSGVIANYSSTADFSMQNVRDIHNRLREWILRNREALNAFQNGRFSAGVPWVRIIHSSGANLVSKQALILRANEGATNAGIIAALPKNPVVPSPSANSSEALIDDDWNMITLFTGRLPQVLTVTNTGYAATEVVPKNLAI